MTQAPTQAPSQAPNQAPNQATDPKKPALCEPCAGIQQNWRRAPGHVELIQGVNRKAERSHGQVTITRYRCERCGTAWEYENNKVNLHAGWSVLPARA